MMRQQERRFPLAITFVVACSYGCASATPAAPDAASGAAGAQSGGADSAGSTTVGGNNAVAAGGATAGTASQAAGAGGTSSGAAGASSGAGGAGAAAGGASSGAGGSAGTAGGPSTVVNAIESISVLADGRAIATQTALDSGELFLLKATGSVTVGSVQVDAEYGGFAVGTAGQDVLAGIDVGVDVGFKVERTPQGVSAGRKKWFGDYRADHTYYVVVTGSGAPLSAKLVPPPAGTGTGGITISLIRLSPTATALAPPLDTVMANVTKPTVNSAMTTSKSVVYLLQASGSGKTGGNNLGLGDADWMDWAADGTGKVDIGDQNVDYGLGVDESNPQLSPRQHWWGPWRKDHSYYMLFAGTGNKIGFSYYDVGDYADNSVTSKIAVNVFAVP